MIRIETGMYKFATGKLPKGYGRWAFGTRAAYEALLIKGVNPTTGLWFIYGAYAQARAAALQKAEAEGVEGILYVLP